MPKKEWDDFRTIFAHEDDKLVIRDSPRSCCRGTDGVRRYDMDGGTTIVEERMELRQQNSERGRSLKKIYQYRTVRSRKHWISLANRLNTPNHH